MLLLRTRTKCNQPHYYIRTLQLKNLCDWVASSEEEKRKLFSGAAQEVWVVGATGAGDAGGDVLVIVVIVVVVVVFVVYIAAADI